MYQDKFIQRDDIYFLNHSVGCLVTDSQEVAANKFFQPWQEVADGPWKQWRGAIHDFRSAAGLLFNSAAKNFCPQVNLSQALTKILFSVFAESSKKTILLSEQDFPSIAYVVEKVSEQLGYTVRFIPKDLDVTDINIWDEYLTDDVFIALVTHVYSNIGCQSPVTDIVGLCKQRNIISVVDVAQSAGVLPIDLSKWDASFVIGSCIKWLCGGPGAGYLWVNPNIIKQCKPVDVGWFSHENPFEFDIHDFRYHETALRFWGGSPSVLPYVIATNSINTLHTIGIDTIRQHNLALTQRIIDKLDPAILVSPAGAEQRSGTLVLDFADRQQQIMQNLQQEQVRFDVRATGMRLSPHIYNTVEQLDQVLACFD